MSEFDLVPSEYRKKTKLKARLKLMVFVYVLLVLVIYFANVMLDKKVQSVEILVKKHQEGKQLFLQDQQRYNDLHSTITSLQRRLETLNALRGGPSAIAIFEMLERVIGKDVWVDSWDYSREGESTKAIPGSVDMGYTIVVQEGNGSQENQAWRWNTHMALNGEAMDYSSLAEFVQALLLQPEIEDVKVQKTNLKQYSSASVIDFSLDIIINNQLRVEQ
ncbi:MAG: hypothetical protein MUQ51_02105 [Pseudomonadota bacterium]|nr:hypothetical protein [Pseudomonadota bacterium]